MDQMTQMQAAMAIVRDITVSDAFLLTSRYFTSCIEEINTGSDVATTRYKLTKPLNPQMLPALGYLSTKCAAAAETFLDEENVKCVLEGRANAVDLLRGWRILASKHPLAPAREIYATLGNGLGVAMQARASLPVDVAPAFNAAADIYGTLKIWYELAVRASQIMGFKINGKKLDRGGLTVVGEEGRLRARIVQEFATQSFSEIEVLLEQVAEG